MGSIGRHWQSTGRPLGAPASQVGPSSLEATVRGNPPRASKRYRSSEGSQFPREEAGWICWKTPIIQWLRINIEDITRFNVWNWVVFYGDVGSALMAPASSPSPPTMKQGKKSYIGVGVL